MLQEGLMAAVNKALRYALIFLFFFGVYVFSMAPSFNSDDSPETALAQLTLGIQHPPGYPLNTLVGKIFTLVPLGGASFRANLSAPFFGALSCLMLYILSHMLLSMTKARPVLVALAALGAAVLYGFGSSAWLQACFSKGGIYTMNSFFAAAFMYSVFKSPGKTKYSALSGFLLGLSCGNHWTSMAVLAPAALLFAGLNFKRYRLRHLASAFIFFMAGASVYLFVFIRSAGAPAYAWGDTKTFSDFMWLITRAQYAGIESKHTIEDTLRLLGYYFTQVMPKEFFAPAFAAVAAGVYFAFKNFRAHAAAMAASYALILLGVASLATPPEKTEWLIKTYLVSSSLFAAFFAGAGILFLSGAAGKYSVHASITALVLAAGGQLFSNNPGYQRYFIGYDYAANITKMTEGRNALLFTEGDMYIGAALYETVAAKKDYAAVIPVVLQYEWYRGQLKRNYGGKINVPPNNKDMRSYIESFVSANADKEIYYSNVFTADWVKNLQPKPEGLLIRILTKAGSVVVSDHAFKLYSFRGYYDDKTGQDDFTRRLVNENYALAYFNFADKLREHGNFGAAAKFYGYGTYFREDAAVLINAGLCRYYMNHHDEAYRLWSRAAELDKKNPLPYMNIAYIFITKRDTVNAVKYVDMALARQPDNANALALKRQLTGSAQ